MSKISVIIVSWNARAYLQNCLDSIRKNSNSLVHEIIVVDNASSDGSPEMVEKLFPDVMLIRSQENLGFARANNKGIERASGDYLALVNSDVIVHAQCFERLAGFLDENKRVGLIGPKVIGGDGHLQRSCRRLPSLWNLTCRALMLDQLLSRHAFFSGFEMRHWNHDEMAEVEVLSGCFWLARRSAVAEVGVLDERFFFYAEDLDWCKRFRDANWKLTFVPTASATHFGGGSSSNAPLKYSIEMLKANLAYWQKHHGGIGRAAFYGTALLHHFVRFVMRGLRQIVRGSAANNHKFSEHAVCLRWLLTGVGV